MNPLLRNILAVIAGIFLGSVVNMAILAVGGSIVPPPEGADVSTMEGLKESMPLFEPKHFIMPFLAHAIGAFLGALAAGALAVTHKTKLALGVSAWFLIGGIISVFMLPSPAWFTLLDLVGAYLPMGYLAGKLTTRQRGAPAMTMETK
ncbi:MAG: hypothetical protein WEB33_12230 [Bacteroidota bacterium]